MQARWGSQLRWLPATLECRKSSSLKQTLDVWAKVRSVSNFFFFNHQCDLMFHKILTKTNRFISLVTQSFTNFFGQHFLIFGWFWIKFIFGAGCFTLTFWFSFWTNWTKMCSKAKLLDLTRWPPSYRRQWIITLEIAFSPPNIWYLGVCG